MPCAMYSHPHMQNAFWKRLTQADEVTNLFVWNFKRGVHTRRGQLPWNLARLQGSRSVRVVHSRLSDKTSAGFWLLVDNAFP